MEVIRVLGKPIDDKAVDHNDHNRKLGRHRDVEEPSDSCLEPRSAAYGLALRTEAIWVSENPIHRKVVRALVHSSSPLRIVLPLHMGFPGMSSGTNWVSENSVHWKPSFREHPFPAARE